ncbi:MAG TPA: hypothetical protein VKP30_03570, partial [Polyangiaceae bacterium]|nr:hypothetical protein [Polyangiaceae bacterium]
TVLTRLAPSDPRYHRQLGVLLAEHGGLLEIERADEALRVALALEPEWSELEQMRQKLAARRYDSPAVNGQLGHAAPPPTENAVRLYGEAESSLELEPTNQQAATDLVEQALRESPSYVEAAALLFTLNRRVHEATVTALWNDASGLFSLYREFSRLEPSVPRPTLDGWLNRAIELGSVEGRMSRALGKRNHGDVAAAEVELSNYLALVSNREDVEAVQTLRAELTDRKHERGTEHDLLLNARLRLQRDDVEGALAILEAPCSASMGPERFLAIGTVYERQGESQRALDCYELALAEAARNEGTPNVETQLEWTQQEWTQKITRRATRLLARAEVNLFEHPFARRLVELSATQPAALWALARHALARGKSEEAERYAARYLASADPEDRFVRDARVLERQLAQKAQAQLAGERRQRRQLQGIGLVALAVLGLGSYLVLFRGSTVARAIRRRARLFPELSRIVGELRHDVFKHRTSALELLRDEQTTIEQLRSTLLDPVPTSQVIADAYGRLVSLARAEGITLRRLQREPVFGRLVRELYAMERALAGTGDRATILAADTRLRTTRKQRLDGLLAMGPRCRLDAAKIQGWISAIQAEYAAKGRPWTVPALQMSDPCLAFPIDESALFQIFANLLRNAEAAVEGMASPQIQVALVHASDFTGQPLVRLEISDNAPGEVREEAIEAQSPGRGLGIVRDTVRDWNGHLVVRRGNEAHRKSVGVEFRQ